jgi:hypothetical protein
MVSSGLGSRGVRLARRRRRTCLDLGTLPLPVYVGGDTYAEVETNKAVLQAAVDQWSYELTLTVEGAGYVFTAECVDDEIAWGEIDSGMVRARICRGTVAIPLYPEGA